VSVDLAVYLPLLLPPVAAAGAWSLATRLPPRLGTWMLTGAAVTLAALSTAVLGILALTAILRIPLVASTGHLSAAVIRREDPASLSAALVAAVLLAAATFAAARAGWRRARALVSAARDARCLPGPGQVAVIPDGVADAYTVPGWPGRIVVTAGMLDALDPAERRVLLAHERAHADNHHYLFTALAHFAAAANPLLRPVATAVSYTVERWADESAARHCGDRRLAARAVGKAALASSRTGVPRSPQLAPVVGITGPRLSPVRRLTGRGSLGPVPRRVAALLTPAPSLRPLLVAAAATVVLISGVAALDAAYDLHALVELAQAPAFLTRS
jgi:Zn-dependent protease with chaperone function